VNVITAIASAGKRRAKTEDFQRITVPPNVGDDNLPEQSIESSKPGRAPLPAPRPTDQ
jgi:hypothetical protein